MDEDAHAPPPYTGSAANPSPGSHGNNLNHPPYADMITAAIKADNSLGKAGGSSRQSIAKYIERVYSNLPPSHSSLLTHHLKRLKNTGYLIMVKNSYLLSSSSNNSLPSAFASASAPSPHRSVPSPSPNPNNPNPNPNPNPTLKRGPGRPAKPKSESPAVDNGLPSAKRGRGRPPKQDAAKPLYVQPISEAPPPPTNPTVQKKRPGRPAKQPKLEQPSTVPFGQPVSEGLSDVAVNGTTPVVKRGRGRPPRVGGGAVRVISGKPRGRPRKNALSLVSRVIGKKPRGRPPKLGGVGGGLAGVVRVKRGRGRPPKVGGGGGGGGAPMRRRKSGRPVGRPRKDASTERMHASDARQAKVNEELMGKVEYIQSKIKEAVGVLRPHVGNEEEALLALDELEELAAMDVTPMTSNLAEHPIMAMPESMAAPPNSSVPVSSAAAAAADTQPIVSATVPFDESLPTMTQTAPSGLNDHQPGSWFDVSEAAL